MADYSWRSNFHKFDGSELFDLTTGLEADEPGDGRRKAGDMSLPYPCHRPRELSRDRPRY